MRSLIASLACVLVLTVATGCGTRLNKKHVRKFQLGQTPESSLHSAFGKPDVTDDRSDGTGVSRVMKWSGRGPDQLFFKIPDVRVLIAESHNSRLRAWMYASSAPGAEGTKIRKDAVPQIVKGQTTREEVVRLLGEPAGKALRGTLMADYQREFGPGVDQIWGWVNFEGSVFLGADVTVRILLVKFDASGRVVDTIMRSRKG